MIRKFLCNLGIHGWYSDSAVFTSVHRCNYCPVVDSEYNARRLDYERELFSKESGNDLGKAMANVMEKLAQFK